MRNIKTDSTFKYACSQVCTQFCSLWQRCALEAHNNNVVERNKVRFDPKLLPLRPYWWFIVSKHFICAPQACYNIFDIGTGFRWNGRSACFKLEVCDKFKSTRVVFTCGYYFLTWSRISCRIVRFEDTVRDAYCTPWATRMKSVLVLSLTYLFCILRPQI